MAWQHTPVLLDEALVALDVRQNGCYLDATFGRGGHTAAILERVGKEGRVIAVDRDPEAIRAGRERFESDPRLTLVNSPFSQLLSIANDAGDLGFRSACEPIGRGDPCGIIHAHVERTVLREAEAARSVVELRR